MVDAAGGEPGPVRRDHDFGHRFVVAGEGGPVAGSTCMAPQDAHRPPRLYRHQDPPCRADPPTGRVNAPGPAMLIANDV
jgi:hypothetical protein